MDEQTTSARYARVVVEVAPAHLDHPFDYRIPEGWRVAVGQRVRVVFAGRRRTGWVVGLADEPGTDPARVRDLAGVQGRLTWFDPDDLAWLRWVARRYAAPLASVLRHAFPARVAAVEAEAERWPPAQSPTPPARATCPAGAWGEYDASALLRSAASVQPTEPGPAFALRTLPGDDRAAMTADLVRRALSAGRSALVLAPDPSSPLPDAALAVAGGAGADLRVTERRERVRALLRCRTGHARVAVGERSAVFAPLRALGLVVVADEANPAFKERRAPRHHAREVALGRARLAGATCVLLSDLPSASVWRLSRSGHVVAVTASRGVERDRAPRVDVVDLTDPHPATRRTRFSDTATQALGETVDAGRVAVVLAARRGQGAALACRGCRRRLACPDCDGALRPAGGSAAGGPEGSAPGGSGGEAGWECPTCEWSGPRFACPDCGAEDSAPLAAGAGRLAAELARAHPEAEVVRMEGYDAPGPAGRPAIAVMTRGSVVSSPSWLGDETAGCVILPDADAMLGRARLDAGEDALRLWLEVARWTVPGEGRPRSPVPTGPRENHSARGTAGGARGRVVVQTREAGNPAVQALVRWDPDGFWRAEADRRGPLGYPPHSSLVRITADDGAAVAEELRAALPAEDEVLGPDLDGTLLVKSRRLHGSLEALAPLRWSWGRDGRGVRVDVDPVLVS